MLAKFQGWEGGSWKCGTLAFVKDSYGNLSKKVIKWGIHEEGNTC